MRGPIRYVTAFVLVLATCAIAQEKRPAPAVHPDVVRLMGLWLDSEQAYHQLPSLVAAVVKGDEVVFARGYGSVDGKRSAAATPHTLFSICSVSKLFTAIAILQLQEQGKLRLDDDVAVYLPELKLAQPDATAGPVTIRSVLTHSSGLPREALAGDYWTGPAYPFPERKAMLEGLARQEMNDRPANRFHYSNLGLALLGEVVERVSGVSYDSYLAQNVFAPLGLRDTFTRMPVELRGQRLAVGHGVRRRDGTREALDAFDARGVQPAVGLVSTVNDMATFAKWQLRVLRTGRTEVLRPDTLREMHRVHWTDPDGQETRGLGFAVQRWGNDVAVGHAGWCPGYRSLVALMPGRDLGVALAMGSADPKVGIGRRLLELALKNPSASTPAVELGQYSGRYVFQPWSDETLIFPWGGDLAILSLPSDNPGQEMRVLRHVGKDDFRVVRDDRSLGDRFSFRRDSAGRIDGLLGIGGNWSGVGRRSSGL